MKHRPRVSRLTPRAIGQREISPHILVVCEDESSGRRYFLTLRRELRLSGLDVFGPDEGTDPLSIVDYAVRLKRSAITDGVPYDELWRVIDGDRPERLARALDKARANGVRVAVSTPCIEVWFRLHWEYSTRPCGTSKKAVKMLREVLPTYEKGADHADEWRKRWPIALKNGTRLSLYHRGISNGRADPSTEVHLLVALLAQHRTDVSNERGTDGFGGGPPSPGGSKAKPPSSHRRS
jgi:hypothetical protein